MRNGIVIMYIVLLLATAAGWGAGSTGSPQAAADQAFATARQLLQTGNAEQAVGALKQFLATYPNDPRVRDAAFMLGNCYLDAQQYDQALPLFTLVIEKATAPEASGLRAEAYFHLGECHFEKKHFPAAGTAFAACRKLCPADVDLSARASYWLAQSLEQQGKSAEALTEYRKAAEIAPTHELAPWSLWAAGAIALDQGDAAGAIAALEQVTAQFKTFEALDEVAVSLANAYAARAGKAKDAAARDADLAKATALLTGVLESEKTADAVKPQAALALGQLYADRQEYAKAEAAYARALAALAADDPRLPEARLQHGHTLYNLARYPDAAAEYAKAANAPNLSAQALYWLGNSHFQQLLLRKDAKTAHEAISALRRFLAAGDAQPQASRATLIIALCYEQLGALNEAGARVAAITAFQDVLTKWPQARETAEATAGVARVAAVMPREELVQVKLPDGPPAWEVILRLAEAQFTAGQYAEAIAGAKQVLAKKPTPEQSLRAAYVVAAAYQKLGKLGEALPFFQQVLGLSKDPEVLRFARYGQTRALLEAKRFPEAAAAAQALVALPDTTPIEKAQRLMLLADALVGVGKELPSFPSVTDVYTRVITDYPDTPAVPYALMGRAWLAERKPDPAAAIAAYREMLAKFPTHALTAEAAYRLGLALNERKEFAQAIAALVQVPATHAQADHAAYTIAWAYRDLNKPDEADAQFARVLEKFPKSPLAGNCLLQLGEYRMGKQQYAEAAALLARAQTALGPEHKLAPAAAYELGICAYNTKDYATAATAFGTVTAKYPASDYAADSLFWKSRSLEQQGAAQAAAAREGYLAYLKQSPAGPLAADAQLGAGRTALTAKQYPAARADLQKALELCVALLAGKDAAAAERAKNVQPEAQFYLAQSHAADGQYPEAITAFAGVSAYPLEPWYSRSMLEMARCSARAGNLPAAERTLRLLRKNFPKSDAAQQAPELAREYKLGLE